MKIQIHFWHPAYCDKTPYNQNQQFEKDELFFIIDTIIKLGLNIMIDQTSNKNVIILHVDGKYRFKQR